MSARSYLLAGLIGAAAGALAVGLAQQARISGLQDRLVASGVQAQVLQQANAACASDVQAARDGWDEYRRLAAEREAAARVAVSAAQARAATAQQRAEALASRPPAPGGECEAAADLLGEYREGRR